MKKISLVILLLLIVNVATGCSGNKSASAPAPTVTEKPAYNDFTQLGLTEGYYNETKTLIDKYRSDDYKNSVIAIYYDFGEDTYDSDRLQADEKKLESGIRSDYYNVFTKCTSEADKNMVLFGYNYSKLCDLQFDAMGMGIADKMSYTETLDEYYNLFYQLTSTEPFDDFCLYITKNNVFDYTTTITKISLPDAAAIIQIDCSLFDLNATMANYALHEEDMLSMYDYYCDAMDNLLQIVADLREYNEYVTEFTSADLNEIETMANDGKEICKNFTDAYLKNDISGPYRDEFLDNLNKVDTFYSELSSNVKALSD